MTGNWPDDFHSSERLIAMLAHSLVVVSYMKFVSEETAAQIPRQEASLVEPLTAQGARHIADSLLESEVVSLE